MLGVPHRHIKRMIVWYLIILAVLVGVLYGVYWWHNRSCTDPASCGGHVNIKDYSLGGEVTAVSADQNQFTMKTGWVSNGKYVYYDRTVMTTADTKMVSVSKQGTVPVLNKNPLDYLRVGDKITITGTGNPYTATTLTATQIQVQR